MVRRYTFSMLSLVGVTASKPPIAYGASEPATAFTEPPLIMMFEQNSPPPMPAPFAPPVAVTVPPLMVMIEPQPT